MKTVDNYRYSLSRACREDEEGEEGDCVYFVKAIHVWNNFWSKGSKVVAEESHRDLWYLAHRLRTKNRLTLVPVRGDGLHSNDDCFVGEITTEQVMRQELLEFYEGFYELSQYSMKEIRDRELAEVRNL